MIENNIQGSEHIKIEFKVSKMIENDIQGSEHIKIESISEGGHPYLFVKKSAKDEWTMLRKATKVESQLYDDVAHMIKVVKTVQHNMAMNYSLISKEVGVFDEQPD